MYNAWLTHLIGWAAAWALSGSPVKQRSFDMLLSGLGSVVHWGVAEKIAVSLAVLIFFWGAFALVCAMTNRAPWFLAPCLAIFAYGWTFEMGFMNCYISLGLTFFALAILLRGRGFELWAAVALVPVIWLAHPFGLGLLVPLGAYALLAGRLPPRYRSYLFVASALGLIGIHVFIRAHFSHGVTWNYDPLNVHDGFNQLLLYGSHFCCRPDCSGFLRGRVC